MHQVEQLCCSCRSTQNGGAIKNQARRLEASDLAGIRRVLNSAIDCNSEQQTHKKITAFSLTLCTRGHEEQWSLRWSDFQLCTLPNGIEVLKYNPSTGQKNYQGGIKERKSMVCRVSPGQMRTSMLCPLA